MLNKVLLLILGVVLGVVLGFGSGYAVLAQTPKDNDPEICAYGVPNYHLCPWVRGVEDGTLINFEILNHPHMSEMRELSPLLFNLEQKVRKNWYRQTTEEKESAKEQKAGRIERAETGISLTILPDGKVDELKLAHPSGDAALDRMALNAVEASKPFLPFPAGSSAKSLALIIYFGR